MNIHNTTLEPFFDSATILQQVRQNDEFRDITNDEMAFRRSFEHSLSGWLYVQISSRYRNLMAIQKLPAKVTIGIELDDFVESLFLGL